MYIIIHAMALYELSKDPYFFDDNPDAIKDAIKMIGKGLKKDEDSTVQFFTFLSWLIV